MAAWRLGNPGVTGYYLATWLRGNPPVATVSELWYNPSSGWFATRGYIGEHSTIHGTYGISSVIAWMPLPKAAGDATSGGVMGEDMTEQAKLSPEARYLRDAHFKCLVDTLEAQLHRANYTPTELREAVMLAAIRYDMMQLRPSYLRRVGNTPTAPS